MMRTPLPLPGIESGWQLVRPPCYTRRNNPADPLATLSNREREILQWVAEGKSSVDIGRVVHLSPTTVDTYHPDGWRRVRIV